MSRDYFIFHRNKYHNHKIAFNGEKFDSVMELAYYKYLLDLKEKGIVVEIIRQPHFTLIDGFKYNGKTFRKRVYTPDFLVKYKDGHREVVEVKGYADTAYKLRKALFLKKFVVDNPESDIEFVEIKEKDIRNIDSELKSGELEKAIKKAEKKTRNGKRKKGKTSV